MPFFVGQLDDVAKFICAIAGSQKEKTRMKKTSRGFAVFCLLVFSSAARARIEIELNEDSNFVIVTSGGSFDVPGLNLTSASGNLVPGISAAPWAFFLANTPNQIAYGSLGTQVTLVGELTLDSGWNPLADFPGDFTVDWGNADANFPICPLSGTSVQARPRSGSTIDFGQVPQGDVSAARLSDAIDLHGCYDDPQLTGFDISGASVFSLPNFEAITLSSSQRDIQFDVLLDVNAPPGIYESQLSIGVLLESGSAPIDYTLRAEIVPEPSIACLVGFASLTALIFGCRRRKPI